MTTDYVMVREKNKLNNDNNNYCHIFQKEDAFPTCNCMIN